MSFLHACLCMGLIADHLKKTGQRNELTGAASAGVIVNEARHEVIVDGRIVDLTPTEFRIISLLWKHRGQLCSRKAIFESFNEQQYQSGKGAEHDANINVHMQRLRDKLETNPSQPEYLTTRRGGGYILTPTGKKRPLRAID